MSQEPLDSEPERGSNRGLRHFRDAASTRGRPRVRSFVQNHRNREDGLVGGDLKVVWNFNILHLLDTRDKTVCLFIETLLLEPLKSEKTDEIYFTTELLKLLSNVVYLKLSFLARFKVFELGSAMKIHQVGINTLPLLRRK